MQGQEPGILCTCPFHLAFQPWKGRRYDREAATISAEQERERANQVTIPVPDDKYAKTHATIILSPSTAPEEEPVQEDSKTDAPAAESQENTEN